MTPRALPEGRSLDLGFVPDATKAIIGVLQAEVARQLQICNACRYCEGFAPSSRP